MRAQSVTARAGFELDGGERRESTTLGVSGTTTVEAIPRADPAMTPIQVVPTAAEVVGFLLYDWGVVVPATVVVLVVSKFDLLFPVVGFLYPETRPGTRRVVARLAEVALWLSVPLVVSTRIDLEAVFGAGIGAVFVAYLVRDPLKDSLSDFVAAATIASNRRIHPGVRIRLPDEGVEGVVEDIDTDEVHVRLDDGDLTHVPNGEFVDARWTTVAEDPDRAN